MFGESAFAMPSLSWNDGEASRFERAAADRAMMLPLPSCQSSETYASSTDRGSGRPRAASDDSDLL
jgi:hypothetical protein